MTRMLGAVGVVLALIGCTPADEPPPRADAAAATSGTPAPALEGQGWTGLTDPDEVIEARRALMDEAERLMKPIDEYSIGLPHDAESLHSAATTLERLLLALPHLFPPTTNQYDPDAHDPLTIALPAIWQRFAAFQSFADSAEHAAAALATAEDGEPLRAASTRMRAACDTCHAAFMKPYTPPQVSDEDREFDFDSVLPPN
ncbi:MAG TPA: cytochrome c [Gammaproteobacteria bacterium]|nr:cytochrome c [Gammaproteobacteria bacterium]